MSWMAWFSGRYERAAEDPDSFGNIAKQKGFVSDEDLKRALRVQRERAPLGEILLELKIITELQLEEIILEQDRRRARTAHEKARVAQRTQRLHLKRLNLRLATVANLTANLPK